MRWTLAPAAFFAASISLIALDIGWHAESPTFCSHPDIGQTIKAAGWCLEFWINRYQTLLGGLCTLVAAWIAGYFVLRQTRVAQKQISIMLGEIEPDFIIADPRLTDSDFCITIINQNRCPIRLLSIEVMEPNGIGITFPPTRNENLKRRHVTNGRVEFLDLIEGTRPSAEKAKTT